MLNPYQTLYAKLTWTLATCSILKCDDAYKDSSRLTRSIASHHCLPDELQQSWWHVCELAFRNIQKGHNTFSQSDATMFISSELKNISYFGLIKPLLDSEDTLSLFPSSSF